MTRKFSLSVAILLVLSFLAAHTAQPARVEGGFHGTDAFTLHYTAVGSGPPLVLLAGGPGFSGSYMLSAAEAFDGFQSIVPDQRGTGRSRHGGLDESRITLRHAVADLEALRVHLELPEFSLVGHSWGGILAMAYAAEHPDRVQRLILIGPGGPTLEFHNDLTANIESRLTGADLEAVRFWSAPTRVKHSADRAPFEAFRAALPAYMYERRSILPLIEMLDADDYNQRVMKLMTADMADGYDLTGRLTAFERPVLIVQGRQDPIGETTALQVKELFPAADLRFLDRCGHFPWLEQPDDFRQVVSRFLRTGR